jgi:hypothetical protein
MAGPKVNPLLMILTWQPDHDKGANDTCRGTYLYTWGHFLEHAFVFDQSRKHEDLLPDEIRVEAKSGMLETAFKTKEALYRAYDRGYSHVCFAPTDCYIIVPRILRSLAYHNSVGHDYWGFHSYDEHHIGGGSAYWLSRRAIEAVLAYDVASDYEDRWVGSACRAAGILAIHDHLYRSIEQPYMANAVTVHLSESTGTYDPLVMQNLHMRVIEGAVYNTDEATL